MPFIDLLSEKCDVVSLVESETDYRAVKVLILSIITMFAGRLPSCTERPALLSTKQGAHHAHNVYNFPLTPEARASFDYEFDNQCQVSPSIYSSNIQAPVD